MLGDRVYDNASDWIIYTTGHTGGHYFIHSGTRPAVECFGPAEPLFGHYMAVPRNRNGDHSTGCANGSWGASRHGDAS
jgi:hypothetical protein